MIETRGLTKYYGRTRGIDGLDLSVEAGEFFGFIGPNGAGKSTTIRTLLGLLRPTRGSATVFGLDVTSRGVDIRRRLGYIPAEIGFYGGMTGGAILRLTSRMHGVDPDRGREVAGRLDLDLQRKADELSTGNRKKLAVVLALQHRPELVILDEPSAGLDPLMQGVLFDLLREEHRRGATVFFLLARAGRGAAHVPARGDRPQRPHRRGGGDRDAPPAPPQAGARRLPR